MRRKGNRLDSREQHLRRLAVGAAVLAIVVSACSGSAASPAPPRPRPRPPPPRPPPPRPGRQRGGRQAAASMAPCGTVNIADNPWVGYEADVAVVAYLLKNELGCTVNIKTLSEQVSLAGLPDRRRRRDPRELGPRGPRQDSTSRTRRSRSTSGSQGNIGIIGWFIPKYYADAHPDLMAADTDPKTFADTLNKYAGDFVTSESGGKGQILDGDPSYVTNDEALVKGLGLNFKVVYSGSEAAVRQGDPDGHQRPASRSWRYYWEPNWFDSQINNGLVHLQLPAYTAGCDTNPKSMTCDYPPYNLNKVASDHVREQRQPGRPRSSRTSSGPTTTRTRSPPTSRSTR